MMLSKESILFIAPQPFFQWRGTPIRVRFDLLALSDLGFHIDLLTLPFGLDMEIPGVNIIRVPNPFHMNNIPIGPSLAKAVFDLMLLLRALSLTSKYEYDYIHCVEEAGAIGIILKKIRSGRLVYEKHSEPISYSQGLLLKILMHIYIKVEAYVTRNADAVITGPDLLEQDRITAPHQNIHCISSIPSTLKEANDKQVELIRKKLIRREGEILITYVGSFAPYQGIDLLFESISDVLSNNPFVRFVIIGGREKEIATWKRFLKTKKISDSVSFIGIIDPDQIPNYLTASDILLSPRIAGNNSPIKILDYLKSGKPIVATNISSNRCFLDESVSILTEPTSSSFSAGIVRLLRNHNLRNNILGKGKKIIKEHHSYEEFKRSLNICYDELQLPRCLF